jgi:hypothetical protein
MATKEHERAEHRKQRRKAVKTALATDDVGERAEEIDVAVELSKKVADHRWPRQRKPTIAALSGLHRSMSSSVQTK